MTRNLVFGEAFRFFDQKTLERGMETNANYGLVMKDLTTNFIPPKALHIHKIYLRRGLYKPHETKIWSFIFWIDEMVDYLENFPPFDIGKGLPDDKILELGGFYLHMEWHK